MNTSQATPTTIRDDQPAPCAELSNCPAEIAANEPAATANATSPSQQPSSPAPAAPPATPSLPQPGVDPELSGLIDDVVKDLRQCAANALVWQINMGVHLHQFRDGLGMDDWNQLLNSGRLPFSPRTAQTLARIGKHKVLADMKHAPRLPDALTVLNVIAALPPSVVEQAIAEGRISPDTTLEEAKGLVAEHRAKKLEVMGETVIPNLV